MRSPWEEEEEEENWKLWLLGNGNYPIHRLRTRSRHVPRMTDRGKRGRCESRRTPTRSWLKSLSSSSSSPLPIVRETYACNVRIPIVIIRDTIIHSRIETNLELGQFVRRQRSKRLKRYLVTRGKSMKVSPPVRPWLISCSPNREFLPTIVSCNYFRQRNVKKVTKLKTSCTSSLDDHDIANSPSYPIIRPRKNFDKMYIYRLIV